MFANNILDYVRCKICNTTDLSLKVFKYNKKISEAIIICKKCGYKIPIINGVIISFKDTLIEPQLNKFISQYKIDLKNHDFYSEIPFATFVYSEQISSSQNNSKKIIGFLGYYLTYLFQYFFLISFNLFKEYKINNIYKNFIKKLASRYYYVPEMALQKINEVYLLNKHMPHNLGKVLDIGGGDGYVTKIILEGKKVDTIINVDLFVQQSNYYDFAIKEDITFTILKDEIFDNIISVCTLEHIPHMEQVLGVVSKKLKKGGGFFFTTPIHDYTRFLFLFRFFQFLKMNKKAEAYSQFHIKNSFHVSLLKQKEWIETLEKNGFKVIKIIPFFDSFEFLMFDILNTWARLPSSYHFWDKFYYLSTKYEIIQKILILQLKDFLIKTKSYKIKRKKFTHNLYIAYKK